MSKNKLFTKIFPVAFFLVAFASCKKENSTVSSNTVGGIISGDADFTLLSAAIARAGLTDFYNDPARTYTLFAPNNSAFVAAGFSNTDAINTTDPATLENLLLYHTLGQALKIADLPIGPNDPKETLNSDSFYITGNTTGYYVNGIKLLTGDAIGTNGVIHSIGQLLTPPQGNIIATIEINPDLTFLVAALQRTQAGGTNLFTLLQGGGPYTLFAPTNEAFMAAGYASIDAINVADPNTLAGILKYHILSVRNFTSDFYDGYLPLTLIGNPVAINASGGFTVKGSGNTTPASITNSNIDAYNGVVHVIDEVLQLF